MIGSYRVGLEREKEGGMLQKFMHGARTGKIECKDLLAVSDVSRFSWVMRRGWRKMMLARMPRPLDDAKFVALSIAKERRSTTMPASPGAELSRGERLMWNMFFIRRR
jgi:hypothetical protein